MTARVSVLMATFNSAATLQASLDSVFAQSVPVQLLVADGGSRDGTMDLLRSQGTRIAEVLEGPDRGVYDALNKAAARATAPHCLVLGSDDQLADPAALERLLAGGRQADVIYGDVEVVEADGSATLQRTLPLARFKYGMPFSHQGVLVKTALVQQVPFGMSLASDYRQLYRLYLEGRRFTYVPTLVARFRTGGLSTRHATASTVDRWRINRELRGWRALDVAPFYLAQTAVCAAKPRLLGWLGRS